MVDERTPSPAATAEAGNLYALVEVPPDVLAAVGGHLDASAWVEGQDGAPKPHAGGLQQVGGVDARRTSAPPTEAQHVQRAPLSMFREQRELLGRGIAARHRRMVGVGYGALAATSREWSARALVRSDGPHMAGHVAVAYCAAGVRPISSPAG